MVRCRSEDAGHGQKMQRSAHLRGLLSPILLLPAAVFLVYWKSVFGIALPFFEDVVSLHYPMKVTLAEALRHYAWPTWSPAIFSGYPLMAEGQVGAAYPPNILLFFVFPVPLAFGLSLTFHLVLAGVGMYLFLGSLGLSPWARLIGATAFMFSGFFLGHVTHLNFVHAAAWLPLMFLGASRSAHGGSPARGAVLWGLSWGMQLLASAPQLALYSACATGAYYLYLSLSGLEGLRVSIPSRLGPAAKGVGVAVAVGLATSAVQTIPLSELAALSARHGGLPYDLAMQGSLPPINLISYIFPTFFGASDPDRLIYPGEPLPWGLISWWESCLYIGVFPLLFALVALRSPRRPPTGFFALLLVVSLLLAFGRYTPLGYFVLYQLPGFAYFRFPARISYVTTFAMCVLVGFGVDALTTPTAARTFTRIARGLLLGLIVILLAVNTILVVAEAPTLAAIEWLLDRAIGRSITADGQGAATGEAPAYMARRIYERMTASIVPWRVSIAIPLGLLAAGWVVSALVARQSLGMRRLSIISLALTLVDLSALHVRLVPQTPVSAIASEPTAVAILRALDTSYYRIWTSPDAVSWWHARRSARSEGVPEFRRIFLMGDTGMLHGIHTIDGANQLLWRRYASVLDAVRNRSPMGDKWLTALNVKYILAPPHTKVLAGQARLVHAGEHVWIYENVDAGPRVYVTSAFRVVDNEDRGSTSQVVWDPSREVLLEENPEIPAAPTAEPGRATILAYSDREIEVQAELQSSGLLVLADAYYPGWTAFIDGRPGKILVANRVFRAVALTPGVHLVRFTYNPHSLRLGAVISVATYFVLALVVVGWRVRRARQEVPSIGSEGPR